MSLNLRTKIVNEYDQEIPQSQTADNPVAPWGRVIKVHLFNLGLPMNRYTFVLPSETKTLSAEMPTSASSLYCNTVTQGGHRVGQIFLQRHTRNFEIRRRVLRVYKIEHTVSLSLYLSICWCTLIFPKGCAYTSLSLFLYLNLQKRFRSRSDPNGIQKECFVNLKMCACDREYAKCRTKADAHDKMGFQYTSISVYIIRSHARIQRGDRGSGPPPPPEKNTKKYRIS